MLRPVFSVVLTLLISGTGITIGNAAGFLKFDGIDGESRDDKHQKWIDVLSMDWGKEQPGGDPDRPMTAGGGSASGQGGPGSVIITKSIDASSPKLQQASTRGRQFRKVEIDMRTPGERSRSVVYTLMNARVTSYTQKDSSTGAPVEQLSLNYEKITWTYDKPDERAAEKQKKKGNVDYSWKVEEGEK